MAQLQIKKDAAKKRISAKRPANENEKLGLGSAIVAHFKGVGLTEPLELPPKQRELPNPFAL